VTSNLDETKYPILQRDVMYAGKHDQKQKVFTDYIELNDAMLNTQELDIINERSELFILFSMATLYCCACPIVPLVVMVHNIIDMNMDL
jgi:Calcium-activated chloride channel